jgi:hypothetical protein
MELYSFMVRITATDVAASPIATAENPQKGIMLLRIGEVVGFINDEGTPDSNRVPIHRPIKEGGANFAGTDRV